MAGIGKKRKIFETEKTKMKVEVIKYPTEADWMLVKKCTLVTVGKETNKPPTVKFKKDLLRSRHSPIRELRFVFSLTDIPYWVSVHLCRHVHAQPYVKTQRNDRQSDYDRNSAPQDAPVSMMWSMNAEELITIANKRLCNLASKETKDLVKTICKDVIKLCPEFGGELVPMCVRNGGVCHEIFPCGERDENG
jgi:thymidylate synthase ThyX